MAKVLLVDSSTRKEASRAGSPTASKSSYRSSDTAPGDGRDRGGLYGDGRQGH
jgi:hypothetical protein